MLNIKEKQKIENQLFEDVIEKKALSNIKTEQICFDLSIEEDELSEYFLGLSKENLPLGIKILSYLEKQNKKNNREVENIINNENY